MKLLTDEQYAALYARLDAQVSQSGCTHTLRRTRAWLQKQNCDVRANVEKLIDLGGMCDCEVLMNVTPSAWKNDRETVVRSSEIIGSVEASEFVSLSMLMAVQGTLWSGGENE